MEGFTLRLTVNKEVSKVVSCSVSHVDPELGHWYIIWKVKKVYFHNDFPKCAIWGAG